MLTRDSSLSGSDQTVHAPPPGGGCAGNQGPLQPEVDVDGGMLTGLGEDSCHANMDAVDLVDLLGYESDASVWHCLFGHLGSPVLATYDVGQ